MKLLMVIVGDEFVEEITSILTENKYMATNIGSSGDFLQYGYSVLMIGVKNEDVDTLVNLLQNNESSHNKKNNYDNEVSIYVINIKNHVKKPDRIMI